MVSADILVALQDVAVGGAPAPGDLEGGDILWVALIERRVFRIGFIRAVHTPFFPRIRLA
jgi:hypothetical protein